jgi:hypothetical protein
LENKEPAVLDFPKFSESKKLKFKLFGKCQNNARTSKASKNWWGSCNKLAKKQPVFRRLFEGGLRCFENWGFISESVLVLLRTMVIF